MLFQEIKVKCEGCGKLEKVFSGMEYGAWVEKYVIRPLCKDCTKKVKKFILNISNNTPTP